MMTMTMTRAMKVLNLSDITGDHNFEDPSFTLIYTFHCFYKAYFVLILMFNRTTLVRYPNTARPLHNSTLC